ncbi:MAG: YeeE/YedE family protein, partial [Betaproteobacteria bacterium]|nr:YeeE/YedE family protein [Betaproteobacteria bacterium]
WLAASGQIDLRQSIYTARDVLWLSALVGGVMFGFGMVLASGCGSKTLVRLGSGSLKALVVFVMLGLGAYATLRGITAEPRVYLLDRVAVRLAGTQDLPSLLARHTALSARSWLLLLGDGVGAALVLAALWKREGRDGRLLLGGLGIGLLVAALWWVSGHLGFVPEDPQTLAPVFVGSATNHVESFTFVSPLAATLNWLLLYSDASNVLNIGIVSVFGVIVGSAGHALATRRFRWEGLSGVEDTANHVLGGLLMGIGGVTALGCTVGQGITGVSTLSPTSWLALASIITGGVLGVKYQAWRLERAA